tara:strand:+ start:210 stop:677 length:468 start_codon:yes stop_codon:yes gene_type:complete
MHSFGVVLFNPEIPPNTGNIIRLCANTGCCLHLIKPMGFCLNEKSLRRAGMDYVKNVKISVHENIFDLINKGQFKRYFIVTKYGEKTYTENKYLKNDCFIFGSESKGIPKNILKEFENPKKISIPMIYGSRSLNLANSVSIVIYEALRQNNFQFL